MVWAVHSGLQGVGKFGFQIEKGLEVMRKGSGIDGKDHLRPEMYECVWFHICVSLIASSHLFQTVGRTALGLLEEVAGQYAHPASSGKGGFDEDDEGDEPRSYADFFSL